MTELVLFDYPDQPTRDFCERKVASIRQAARSMLHGIVSIGEDLVEVKDTLGHGLFQPWLKACFTSLSISTAINYMNAYRAVTEFPTCWEFDPRVLYLFTHRLPDEVKGAIVEAKPVSYEDAVLIIQACRKAEWREAVIDTIPEDPGAALHAIEEAMDDPHLRGEAVELLQEYVDEFAHHAGREPWEIKIEAGVTQLGAERPAGGGRPSVLSLAQGTGNYKLLAWIDGIGTEIAVFPKQDDPQLRAWRNAVVATICDHLNVEEGV